MLVPIERQDFEELEGIALVWACIEPTIRKIRGKNDAVKAEVYAQLTEGQQALLMFQILYGHTQRGVEEFFFMQTHMPQGTWSQMVRSMRYFGALEMVRFLEEVRAASEEFRGEGPASGEAEEGTPLFAALRRLDALLRECLPEAIRRVSATIRGHAEQFVMFGCGGD